jgi:hypothetical protein
MLVLLCGLACQNYALQELEHSGMRGDPLDPNEVSATLAQDLCDGWLEGALIARDALLATVAVDFKILKQALCRLRVQEN